MRMNEALQDVMTCDELPVYVNEAKKEDAYPYAVFTTKRLIADTVSQYRMTVNVWDMRDTWNRAEMLAMELEKRIDHMRFEFEGGAGMIYKDTCEPIVVEDKKLKKIELTFEVRVVEE